MGDWTPKVARIGSMHQLLIPDAVRLLGVSPKALLALNFVGLVVALAPDGLAVPFEGQNMGGDESDWVSRDGSAVVFIDDRPITRGGDSVPNVYLAATTPDTM